MEDDRRTPLGPRRRGRASFSMAPPPLRKPTATLPGGGTGTGNLAAKSPRSRGGVTDSTKGGGNAAAVKSPSARGRGGSADSPCLGKRTESPTLSPLPSTRGELQHFRRAEELWKKASKAREGGRRRSMGGTPSPLPVSRQQQQQRANQLTKGQSGFTGSARAATTAGAAAAEGASTGTAPSGGGKRNRGRKQTVTAPPARKLLDGDGQEEGESPPASEANGAAARAAGESRNDEFNGASTAAASSASVDLDRASVRARMLAIYQKHNPDKVAGIDEALDKYEGRWGVMLQRLEDKYVSTTGLPPASGTGPLCFMDIEVGGDAVGRLVFKLFADKTPKAAENFRVLCTGEQGPSLRYEGSAFHRIIPGFVVQGGDFTTGDGTGGKSIYGSKFDDEPFMRHHKLGLLSMANKGKNTNNSQFFITLKAVAHLDGKHVVFGEVQSGISVLDRMKSVTLQEPKRDGKPSLQERVVIAKCGQLHDDGGEMPRTAVLPTDVAHTSVDSALFSSSSPNLSASQLAASRPSPLAGSLCGGTNGSVFGSAFVPSNGDLIVAGPVTPTAPSFGAASNSLFFAHSLIHSAANGSLAAPATPPQVGRTAGRGTGVDGDGAGGGDTGQVVHLPGSPGINRVANSFASLAAAISAAIPTVAEASRRARARGGRNSPMESGSIGDDRCKSPALPVEPTSAGAEVAQRTPTDAAQEAFNGLDASGTGWIGEDDFEALVKTAGMSFSIEKEGSALLELCSPRLPRARFVEWFAATKNKQEQAAVVAVVGSPHEVGRVDDEPASPEDDIISQEVGASPARQLDSETASTMASAPASSVVESSVAGADPPPDETTTSAAVITFAPEPPIEASDDDDDSDTTNDVDAEEERREERIKAEGAFDKVDADGKGLVVESQFGALMKALGATYSEENHKPKLLKTCDEEGQLQRNAFLTWYSEWLFGEEEDSDEDQDTPMVGDVERPMELKQSEDSSSLESQAGRSRIDPCPVSNHESVCAGDALDKSTNSDDDDDDENERREERAKAEDAFDLVDAESRGWVEESQFESLMEAVGTTYAVEDHRPKLLATCEDGHLHRVAFLRWYEGWLFGDDESSDEEESGTGNSPITKSEKGNFASLLKSQDGGWKCGICLVSNPSSASRCLSCETARPGEEGKVASGAGSSASTAGGGGNTLLSDGDAISHKFTFGAPIGTSAHASATLSPGAFPITGPTDESGAENGGVGAGFLLGSSTVTQTSKPPSGAVGVVFRETASPTAVVPAHAPTAAAGAVAQDASKELTFGLACPPAAPIMSTEKVNLEDQGDKSTSAGDALDNSDDYDDDENERREERAKAEDAFDLVDAESRGWVEESQFESLMEAVGTTYAVEDHRPKLLATCEDGHLHRVAFLRWYEGWLFGDDESSDEEESGTGSSPITKSEEKGNFASLLKSQEGGWKCGICLVSNPSSASRCLSCETARPGDEGKVASGAGSFAGSFALGSSDSIFGGKGAISHKFTFGASIESPAPASTATPLPAPTVAGPTDESVGTGFIFGSSAINDVREGPPSAVGIAQPVTSLTDAAPAPVAVSAGTTAREGLFTYGLTSPPMMQPPITGAPSTTGLFTYGLASVPATPSTSAVAPAIVPVTAAPTEGLFTYGLASSPTVLPSSVVTPVVVPAAATVPTGLFTYGLSSPPPPTANPPPAAEESNLEDQGDKSTSAGDALDNSTNSDDDDDDENERREERAKAEDAFDLVDAESRGWVEESQFESLMEAVGTTYAVEDHRPKLLATCEDGHLHRVAFLRWYEGWLFGDDESSDEEESGTGSSPITKSEEKGNFASLLKSQEGGWKCGICLVSNPSSASRCLSCETARPGEEGKVASGAGSFAGSFALGSSDSIFGGKGAISHKFTFGASIESPAPASTATPLPAPTVAGPTDESVGTGFIFGSSAINDVREGPPSAVGIAQPVTSLTDAAPAPTCVDASEPAAGSTSDLASPTDRPTAEQSDDDDDDDENERREERAKAEDAFDLVDAGSRGWVEESQFESLMEAVGTTYAVEDHRPKLLATCEDGHLHRVAFLRWYEGWLFGDDESSDEEESGTGSSPITKSEEKGNFASLLKSQEGGWKCGICLVSNPSSASRCLSCETARPGEEGKVASSTGAAALSFNTGGGDSAGGFTLGSSLTTPGFAATITTQGVQKNVAGGFTFGSPLPVSSGAVAEETLKPVDVSDCSDGSDEDENDLFEERVKAARAFDKVDVDGKGWLLAGQFKLLMEAAGTTYCEENHQPKLLSICGEGGQLRRNEFLMWYECRLFGDDGSLDEEESEAGSVHAEKVTLGEGLPSLSKEEEATWKGDACLVSNSGSTLECMSRETVQSNEEGKNVSKTGAATLRLDTDGVITGEFTCGSQPCSPFTAPVVVATITTQDVEKSAVDSFPLGSPIPASSGAVGEDMSKAADASNGDDSDDENGRLEERMKANWAFDKVDAESKGWVEESQFEFLMEAIGMKYYEEDHRPKLLSICEEGGQLGRDAFLRWCEGCLFADNKSPGEEGEAANEVIEQLAANINSASLSNYQSGGPECGGTSFVSNPERAGKCVREMVQPSEDNGTIDTSAGGSVGLGNGASDKRNVQIASVNAGPAATVDAAVPILDTNAERRILDGAASARAALPVSVTSATYSIPDDGGVAFGSRPLQGAALIAPDATKEVANVQAPDISSRAGVYVSSSDDGDAGGEYADERGEERRKAAEAFDEVDTVGDGWIGESGFEALLQAVGTIYDEENHKPQLLAVCEQGQLRRGAFLKWYDHWLFGEEESSVEEGQDGWLPGARVVTATGLATEGTTTARGFASLLSGARGWRCDACSVSNPDHETMCLTCRAAKPTGHGQLTSGGEGGAASATEGLTVAPGRFDGSFCGSAGHRAPSSGRADGDAFFGHEGRMFPYTRETHVVPSADVAQQPKEAATSTEQRLMDERRKTERGFGAMSETTPTITVPLMHGTGQGDEGGGSAEDGNGMVFQFGTPPHQHDRRRFTFSSPPTSDGNETPQTQPDPPRRFTFSSPPNPDGVVDLVAQPSRTGGVTPAFVSAPGGAFGGFTSPPSTGATGILGGFKSPPQTRTGQAVVSPSGPPGASLMSPPGAIPKPVWSEGTPSPRPLENLTPRSRGRRRSSLTGPPRRGKNDGVPRRSSLGSAASSPFGGFKLGVGSAGEGSVPPIAPFGTAGSWGGQGGGVGDGLDQGDEEKREDPSLLGGEEKID